MLNKSLKARVRSSAKKKPPPVLNVSTIESKILGDILYESNNEIYVFDTCTLKFIYVNKGALENLGYSMEEMLGFTPPCLNREFAKKSFEKLIGTLREHEKERLYFEGSHRRKDGSLYPIEVNLQLSDINRKKVFVAIVRDVSYKQQSDQTIHLLHRAIESGGEGVIIADAKKNRYPIVYVNNEFLKLSGYKTPEVYSMHLPDFFGSEGGQDIAGILKKMFKDKQPFRGEMLCKRKDGSIFWNFLSLSPIIDEAGDISNFIFFNRDVSPQKNAELALMESEKKFRTLAENAPSFILIIDSKGRIQYINRALPGYSNEEMLRMEIYDFMNEKGKNHVGLIIDEVFETGIAKSMEMEIFDREGRQRWFSTKAGPMEKDGKIVSAILVNLNIDEQKRVEHFTRIQNRMLEKIAVNVGVHEVISSIAEDCQLFFKSDFCSILLTDENKGGFRFLEKSYFQNEIVRLIESDCKLNGKDGDCGVLYDARSEIVITDFSNVKCSNLLIEKFVNMGFSSLWSFPIHTSYDRHEGIFIFLFKNKHKPSKQNIEEIQSFITLVSIALEQEKYERELQRLYNGLEQRIQERTEEIVKKNISIQEQQMQIEKQKSIQYKLQSLSAQMNPHFIFNAINAVQYFVFDDDKQKIFGYLSNLSTLFRQALHNSEKTYISLEEETDFLRQYLELECKRMKGKLSYEIKIDEKFEISDILIPPMLVQPYVENAIHHGISPMEGDGRIKIEFVGNEEGIMLCKISDNGIGLQGSSKLKARYGKASHRSLGMNITKTRLELLNSLGSSLYAVDIASGEDKNIDSWGTVITITFPLINY